MNQTSLHSILFAFGLLLPTAGVSAAEGFVYAFDGVGSVSVVTMVPNLGVAVENAPDASGRGADRFIFVPGPPVEFRMVDDRRKSYMVMNQETAAQAAEKIAAMRGQFGGGRPAGPGSGGTLPGMTPEIMTKLREAQEAVRKARGQPAGAAGGPTGPLEIRSTGERARHAGYACVKFEGWRNGDKVREFWVTDWKNLPGGAATKAMLARMRDAYDQLMGSFRESLGAGGSGSKGIKSGGEAFDTWGKLNGFPVVTRHFADGELTSEAKLSSAEAQDIEPSVLVPDPRFKRQDMFGSLPGR